VVLVDGVVCKMHVQIVDIGLRWRFVFLGGKPGQTLIVNVNSQGVTSSYQGINSQVEFKTLIQQRIRNVLLHDTVFIGLNF
jgi:hypothetical protein